MVILIEMIMKLISSWGEIKMSHLDVEQPNQIFGLYIWRTETALKLRLDKSGLAESLHSQDFEEPVKSQLMIKTVEHRGNMND